MRYAQFLAVSLLLCGCASTSPEPSAPLPLEGVTISLERHGSLLDPSRLRMAESGEPERPIGQGKHFWLRLSNRSPFAISFQTESAYMSRPLEPVPIGPKSVAFAVADGAHVVIRFEGYDGRYGFGDMSWMSFLPSGRSVLFQVPKRYLRKRREIQVEFLAYTEAAVSGAAKPEEHRVTFRAEDVPDD